MLGLKLRDEFLGDQMPGTMVSLRTSDNQGAVEKSPDYILSITYPTTDVCTALKALSVKMTGRPIVLMGNKGRGKSHILAVMHHSIQSPKIVEPWIRDWGVRTGSEELSGIEFVSGYFPISEPVHNHEYPLLWNLLFDRHPEGKYFRGQFENSGHPYPPRTLLENMFTRQPTCLILDEFQKWFDGLRNEPGDEGIKYKTWAENFIQNLSEIAAERPDILILVVSCLDNQTEAFRQIHRQGPLVVDFQGPSARQDRQKLILHRLFENRRNILESEIITASNAYAVERFRLLYGNKTESEKERVRDEVVACWPFSPELLELLEDHILLSSAAQETRDMIRILAQVFKSRGAVVPVITPADFCIDGGFQQVQTLIDAISDNSFQDRLRQIAQRNLETVQGAEVSAPHALELISSIWMRSMTPGRNAGGPPNILHLDITRDVAIDDNAFQAELALIIENSVNIHGDEIPGGPLWFGVKENPRSKVRACAKNNRLWDVRSLPTAAQTVYPGKDIQYIRKTLHDIFNPVAKSQPTRDIILGPNWKDDPWIDVDESDRPQRWERPVLLVVPDQISGGSSGISATLGEWLAKHVQKRRNTVRFLLPAANGHGLITDPELLFMARCSFLCGPEGWGADSAYKALSQDFGRPFRAALQSRFTRFAVLRKWDFQNPANCVFDIEAPRIRKNETDVLAQGADIPSGVEQTLLKNLFEPQTFQQFVLDRAKASDYMGTVLDDLMEPPPPSQGDVIPFLGETKIYEMILHLAAQGHLFLNVKDTWFGRRPEDATDEDALRYLQNKAFATGQELRKIRLGLPGSVGGGVVPVPTPTAQPARPATGSGSATRPGSGAANPYPPVGPKTGGSIDNANEPKDAPDTSNDVSGTDETTSDEDKRATHSRKTAEPATGLNLTGCFEAWGVPAAQPLESARIEFSGVTAQQLKQILQRIPSTFKATLEIAYTEGEEP